MVCPIMDETAATGRSAVFSAMAGAPDSSRATSRVRALGAAVIETQWLSANLAAIALEAANVVE
jgi:hypothetical protein